MKKVIGVMGPSKASKSELKLAYQVGKIVAERSAVLLTGGAGGVMEEASRGASEAGGLVLSIGPTFEKGDLNKYVDIPVVTGMRGGRNYMNIQSSDIVIAIGHNSAGTLSEIAFAIQLNRPLIVMSSSAAMRNYLLEFKCKSLYFAKDIEEVSSILKKKKFNT